MKAERKTSSATNGRAAVRPPETSRRGEVVTMTSTEAQNGFGRMLDTVARDGTVLIKKHNVTQAVVMSVDRYEALTKADAPDLDALTAEFDALLASMQTPESKAAMREAFAASPEELGRMAVEAARTGKG